jgi:hypothetical protein
MKRVERRGTLDPHSQTAAFVHSRAHAPTSQGREHVHGATASQASGRSIGRTDTVVVPQPPAPQHVQAYGGPPEPRERERDATSPRSNASSLTVARPKGDAAPSEPSSHSRSRSPTLHTQRNGSQKQPPPSKPPPLSSGDGESDAEGDAEAEEVDDPEEDLLAAVDAAEASSGKTAIAPWVKREVEAT